MKKLIILLLLYIPQICSGQVSYKITGGTFLVPSSEINIVLNAGTVENNGTILDTVGKVIFKGAISTTGNGTYSLNDVIIDHVNDTSELNSPLSIRNTLTFTNGALETNGYLTLSSTSSKTASITSGSSSGGYIIGNVIIERYNTAKRAFRFYSHPFSSSIALNQLTDDIDITGTGGSSNGFTTTLTNNPSSFWFNVINADNSTTGNNPGWEPFTSANANSWDQYELMRLLIRGTKGEGLTGSSYSPSTVTFEVAGSVNQGTQVITLTKGSNSNFVGCGNPFPSGIEMNALSKGSNIGSNYYVWDATMGAKGAYVTNAFSLSYILPSCGAFFTTVTSNSNNTITIEEADKATGGQSLFKTTALKNWVELVLQDSFAVWDRLLINFNDSGKNIKDDLDAQKLYNPGLDFYTLSSDKERLAIDVRPNKTDSNILLGLTAYNNLNKYVIRTGMFDVPTGIKLILHDKYLNKKKELDKGFEYWFDVTNDTLSQGEQRFEINLLEAPVSNSISLNRNNGFTIFPNPTTSYANITFNTNDIYHTVTVRDIIGRVVLTNKIPANTKHITLPLNSFPSGTYLIEIYSEHTHEIEKLIKL